MFGMLNPLKSQLSAHDREQYERYYCGLCSAVGDDFGLWQRALQSSDAVFLAVLADGLVSEVAAAKPGRTRCPVAPTRHQETLDGAALRCAGAVQMHLVDQRLADHQAEGQWLGGARPALAQTADRAWEVLSALGVELRSHGGIAQLQLDLEHAGAGPAAAAEPTAQALADAFQSLTELPGAAVTGPIHRATLARLGASLGRSIYLIDALEDLLEDLRGGAFNPCIQREGEAAWIDPDAVARCADLLEADAERLRADVSALPLVRNERLVQHILLERLTERRASALAAADALATQALAERSLAAPWPVGRRFAHAVSALCVMAWVWLSALPAALAGDAMPMASNQCGGSPCEKACCGCVAKLFGFD